MIEINAPINEIFYFFLIKKKKIIIIIMSRYQGSHLTGRSPAANCQLLPRADLLTHCCIYIYICVSDVFISTPTEEKSKSLNSMYFFLSLKNKNPSLRTCFLKIVSTRGTKDVLRW